VSAIEVEHLQVARGGRAVLLDLSLTVEAGRVTGLLGPSGCGKSTLMRSIVGVQIVSGGRIVVLGYQPGEQALRREIGYVTQAPAIYGDLTVEENVRYFSRISGAGPGRVAAVLEQVDLRDLAGQVVHTLSGGQRSRVLLATALVHEPRLLILDEPTVGLDPLLRERLWGSFRELAAAGVTLLVSSHSMEEAAECDDLLLMRDGRLLASVTPAGLQAQTGESDLAKAFLALVRGTAS
jgi:ABC-2 type transport system ATP-binding protein